MHPRIEAVYHVRCDAQTIEERARAIAIEQSIEMPLAAVTDDYVRSEIVGRVEDIREKEHGLFEVRITLAAETVRHDAGQLINMLFGNSSLHADVVLDDVVLPAELVNAFGGPRHGLNGLRQRVEASTRALTCSPLKPQGLPAAALAELARRFAHGGVDYIKDDHGLADQARCCEVHDGHDVMFGEGPRQRGLVGDVAHHQRARGEAAVAGRKVVVGDGLVTRCVQRPAAVRADIAGAAGDENGWTVAHRLCFPPISVDRPLFNSR